MQGPLCFATEDQLLRELARARGGTLHVATSGRGDFFGDIAFLDNGIRTAEALAGTDVELFVLARAAFDRAASRCGDGGAGVRAAGAVARAAPARHRRRAAGVARVVAPDRRHAAPARICGDARYGRSPPRAVVPSVGPPTRSPSSAFGPAFSSVRCVRVTSLVP